MSIVAHLTLQGCTFQCEWVTMPFALHSLGHQLANSDRMSLLSKLALGISRASVHTWRKPTIIITCV